MDKTKQWLEDDITFCIHKECLRVDCIRHPIHIHFIYLPHSVADFKGVKEYCLESKEEENDKS